MASAEDYAGWIVNNEAKRGTPEFDTVATAYKAAREASAASPEQPPASAAPVSATTPRIAQEAAYKGVAGLGDMFLNAPTNLLNLGKAAVGTIATAAGRPDMAPDLSPTPDLARRGMEAAGLIDPKIQPQGGFQKGVDLLTQGAVGGALTGGASLPRIAVGAGMGAMSTGAQGATEAITGSPAAGIAAGLLAPAGVGRMLSSRGTTLTPQQKLLTDEGVSLTPGQIKGGTVRRMEDAATSWPILGDTIKAAQRRGIEGFDAAAINRSLAPIGERLPMGLKGGKAIEYAYGKLGDAYDNLLPNLKGDLNAVPRAGTLPAQAGQPAPPSFRQELDQIRQIGQNLPEAQRSQLEAIIDREVIGQFTQHGLASGESLKSIESLLGTLAKKKAVSENYHENQLGGAIQEIQAAMRRMVNEVNPSHAGELAKINEGYANFKRVQNAAGRPGAQEGIFSPSQLNQAVRAGDKSKDKARYAEGNALMQDLSGAGKAVLPSTVPDSGTALRSILAWGAAHPLQATVAGAPLALGSLAYSPGGQRALQSFMTRQGNPVYSEVANHVAPVMAGSPYAGNEGTLAFILQNELQKDQQKNPLRAPGSGVLAGLQR